jgi:hypothetical protein
VLKLVGEGSYVPHGLRATAAIRLIEAGCSEDQAAAITGHRDLNVLRGYVPEQPSQARPASNTKAGGRRTLKTWSRYWTLRAEFGKSAKPKNENGPTPAKPR